MDGAGAYGHSAQLMGTAGDRPSRRRASKLNAISLACELSSTSFRVAYVIADHISLRLHLHASLAEFACRTNRSTEP
jgi:hypothetical protein